MVSLDSIHTFSGLPHVFLINERIQFFFRTNLSPLRRFSSGGRSCGRLKIVLVIVVRLSIIDYPFSLLALDVSNWHENNFNQLTMPTFRDGLLKVTTATLLDLDAFRD